MARRTAVVLVALLAIAIMTTPSSASVVYIGGEGAVSTSDEPNGSLGLLSNGEVATATLEYSVNEIGGTAYLTLTVTNTSPAVLGTEAPTTPDAPSISDIMFNAPCVVSNMTLLTVGGESAADTGWDFAYDVNGEPGRGFGFLKAEFDAYADGGAPGDPAPVIASIFDPDLTDGPGKPTLASPIDFVFTLSFVGSQIPANFCADWFVNKDTLCLPTYIAAAKFVSGANGGSGTVTDDPPLVPAPASLMLLLAGLAGVAVRAKTRN